MDSPSRHIPAGALARSWSRSVRSPIKHWRTRAVSGDSSASVINPRTRKAGSLQVSTRPLGIDYPADVFSLSHIALPFAADDALYGHIPRAGHPLQLGSIALRGERNTLVVPQASLERLSYNPFHEYMLSRISALLPANPQRAMGETHTHAH